MKKAQPDHVKYPSEGFTKANFLMKWASSVVSLASLLASDINNLKLCSTSDFDDHEEAAVVNEPSGTTGT
ncbi:12517_t:CDS:2, partial [Racocetra fulgida]